MKSNNQLLIKELKKQKYQQCFVLLGMIFLLIFSFTPMFGILMAFKNYHIESGIKGIFTSEWAGLQFFKEFFSDYKFGELVQNTLAISLLKIIFTFPVPILLAIMLSEVKNSFFKRFAQTSTYLPHFISWVVVSGISFTFFSEGYGLFNHFLQFLHLTDHPIGILTDPDYFWGLTVGTAMWKETGWVSIIFLASISTINPELYEAARIDGAGRIARIWYVTLPGMKTAISTVLILTIGSLLGGGMIGSNFEQSYLFGNSLNNAKSEIIQTYAFKMGLAQGRFSYATAIDLIQSMISVSLVFISNKISKKVSGTGLF